MKYEFECLDCRTQTAFFTKLTEDISTKQVKCRKCNSVNLERIYSFSLVNDNKPKIVGEEVSDYIKENESIMKEIAKERLEEF